MPEVTTRPTNDAYTGMLGISLFALLLGCVLLYLDYSQYPDAKGPAIPKSPPVASPGEGGPGDGPVLKQGVASPKKAVAEPTEEAAPEPGTEKK